MTNKDQFYYQGKYFEKQEDFWAYVKEWQTLALDQETAERLTETFKRDIVMNTLLTTETITNIEFSNLLGDTFTFFIATLRGRKKYEIH